MAASTDTSHYALSQMREDIKRSFQGVRVRLNQREQELLKRISSLEQELKSHSDAVQSDLSKLRRSEQLLGETLDSMGLADTQEIAIGLVRDKIAALERSKAEFKCDVSLSLDTGALEALIPCVGAFSDERTPSPSSPLLPLPVRRSHTPDPFSEPLPRRPNRYSYSHCSDTSRRLGSFSGSCEAFSVSEEPCEYRTPQPERRKVSGRIAKLGRARK